MAEARLQLLLQLSQTTPSPDLSRYYGHLMYQAAEEQQMEMHASVKRRICLHCGTLFEPASNCRVRLRSDTCPLNDQPFRWTSKEEECGKDRGKTFLVRLLKRTIIDRPLYASPFYVSSVAAKHAVVVFLDRPRPKNGGSLRRRLTRRNHQLL